MTLRLWLHSSPLHPLYWNETKLTLVILLLPSGLSHKASTCQCRRLRSQGMLGSIPGLGTIPPEKSLVTHSSIPAWKICWWATVHRVTKSQTWLERLSRWAGHSLAQNTWRLLPRTESKVMSSSLLGPTLALHCFGPFPEHWNLPTLAP